MRLALEPTYPFPGPSGAQQPEIPTPALNLMGFTGNIRPRSPSKATPADVGRATSTSIVFNDMCDVPSKEIPSTFSSTALDTASIVAQAQKTQSPAFILSSNVEFLLSEFTKLRANLVAEVHSTQYEVAQDVRERFESDINQRHDREKLQVCRRHSLDLAKDVGPCEEDANLTLMSSADSHKTKVGMGSRGPSFETARQCNHHQTMTLQTEIEPIQVPNDVRAPPIVFSEARKRNATASHHFRVKRKEREAAMKSLKPQSPSRERRQRTLSRTREKEHQSTNSVDVYPTQETPICDEAQMNKETRILHSHPSYKPFPITSTDTVESTKRYGFPNSIKIRLLNLYQRLPLVILGSLWKCINFCVRPREPNPSYFWLTAVHVSQVLIMVFLIPLLIRSSIAPALGILRRTQIQSYRQNQRNLNVGSTGATAEYSVPLAPYFAIKGRSLVHHPGQLVTVAGRNLHAKLAETTI